MPDITDQEMETLLKHGAAKPISKTESALRATGEGVTLGWQPTLSGLAEKLIAKIALPKEQYKEMYESVGANELKKSYESENEEARKANPKTYVGFSALGSLPTAGTLSVLPGVNAIAAGGLAGGVQGASSGDTLKEKALNATIGGGTGLALGLAAQKAVPALTKVSKSAGIKAFGFLQTQLKKVGGLERAEKSIDTLIRSGGILKPWRGAEGTHKALKEVQEATGNVISSTLKRMDDEGISSIDPTAIYDRVANTEIKGLGKSLSQVAEDVPEVAKELTTFSDRLSKLGKEGGEATFAEMQYQKQLLRKSINWTESDAAGNMGNQAKKVMYSAINDAIDSSLDDAANSLGSSEIATEFLRAKQLYGAASTAESAISNQLRREAANKSMSLTDWILAAGGMGGGALTRPDIALPAVSALIAKKVLEKYGWQTLATGANLARKTLEAPRGLLGKVQQGLSPGIAEFVAPIERIPLRVPVSALGAAGISSSVTKKDRRK